MSAERTTVTVRIGGEDYSLRALASPDYTRECAAYVDRTMSEIVRAGAVVEAQKALILASMSLADELFQAREELETLRAETARTTEALASSIEDRLARYDLAAGS